MSFNRNCSDVTMFECPLSTLLLNNPGYTLPSLISYVLPAKQNAPF